MALTAGAALAADITPMPSSGWTGGYVGLIGGYAWGDASLDAHRNDPVFGAFALPTSVRRSENLDGWLGGAQIGYDYEVGSGFVLGAAADFAFTGAETDAVCLEGLGALCDHPDADHTEAYADMNWLSTIRARAGFAVGDALIYATGGVAFGGVEVHVDNLNYKGDNSSDSDTRTGWTVGGGAEYKVTENVSVGAEYLYVDLGSVDTKYELGPYTVKANTDFTTNIVRASLNYRF
ncbi:outer membrane protein [Aestuariivirga sp.]|uniref:outer membrane protein n=1 Tax=Aestuariivirga sp. TaxID=2650926 RepID=UPI003019519E